MIAAAMVARPTVVRSDGHQPADHIGVHDSYPGKSADRTAHHPADRPRTSSPARRTPPARSAAPRRGRGDRVGSRRPAGRRRPAGSAVGWVICSKWCNATAGCPASAAWHPCAHRAGVLHQHPEDPGRLPGGDAIESGQQTVVSLVAAQRGRQGQLRCGRFLPPCRAIERIRRRHE